MRRMLLLFIAMVWPWSPLSPCSRQNAGISVTQATRRRRCAKIQLPPGFHIALYARVPYARGLALAPDGETLIVGTSADKIYKVTLGRDEAAKVEPFAPGEKLVLPNGPCFAPDGTLFIAAFDRILRFSPRPGGGWDEDHPQTVVPPGALIPATEKSHGHGLRVCRVGPDGKLYVALGQPTNVPTKAQQDVFAQWGMGGILRMDPDGANKEIFASGIRNSVGMDFEPKDENCGSPTIRSTAWATTSRPRN